MVFLAGEPFRGSVGCCGKQVEDGDGEKVLRGGYRDAGPTKSGMIAGNYECDTAVLLIYKTSGSVCIR